MRTQFTYGNLLVGFMGVIFLAIIVLVNGTVQCTDKKCEQALGGMEFFGIVISLGAIVFGVFVPFFKSIKPVDIREELAEESGSPHGTLPKGFEQPSNREVKE